MQKQLVAAENSKAPAVRQVKALMKQVGVTVEDLATKPAAPTGRNPAQKTAQKGGRKVGAKIPVKYRDENGNSWTGRGKTPIWIVEAEKAGNNRADYLIL